MGFIPSEEVGAGAVEDPDPEAAISGSRCRSAHGQRRVGKTRRCSAVAARRASRHWLRPSLDRVRVSVGSAAHSEPRTESRRPSPVFIAQCDRGPPAIDGLGAPDQGAGQGWEIILKFSPLISTFL